MKLGEGFIEITPRIQRGFERSLSAGLSHVGATLTKAITTPLSVVGGLATNAAARYEKSMSTIQALTYSTAAEVERFSDIIKQEAPAWGQAPEDLANTLFVVAASGERADEALASLEATAKASTVGLGEQEDLFKVAAAAVAGYGRESMSTARAMDILTVAGKQSADHADEIGANMLAVVPIAAGLNVTLEDTAAAMAALTRTLEPAQAGTALRQLLVTLQKPSQQARDMLQSVGLSIRHLRDELEDRGLLSVLNTLTEAFGDNQDASAILFNNVRALTGFMALTNMEGNELAQIFAEVHDSAGAMGEAFDIISSRDGFRLEQSMNRIRVAMINVGDVLLPHVASAFEYVGGLFQWFSDLSDESRRRVMLLVAAAAGLGPAFLAAGKLLGAVEVIGAGIAYAAAHTREFLAAIRAFGIAGLLVWTPLAAKVAAVVAAIAALVAIAIKMYNESDNLREQLQRMYDTFMTRIVPAAKEVWDAFNDLASAIGDILGYDWDNFGDAVATNIETTIFLMEILAGQLRTTAIILQWFAEGADRTGNVTEKMFDGDFLGALREAGENFRWLTGNAEEWNLEANITSDNMSRIAKLLGSEVDPAVTELGHRINDGPLAAQRKWNNAILENIALLEEQMGKVRSAHDAKRSLHDAIDRVHRIVEEADGDFRVLEGTLDLTDATTRELDGAFADWVDKLNDATTKALQAEEPFGDVLQNHKDQKEALRDLMMQFGMTEEEAEEYLETLGLIPPEILTQLKLEGAKQVEGEIAELLAGVFQVNQGLGRAEARARAHSMRPDVYHYGFSRGGLVRGPGTSTSDSIPARLSDFEFVMPASAVKHWGVGVMEALRRNETPAIFQSKIAGGLAVPPIPLGPVGVGSSSRSSRDVTVQTVCSECMRRVARNEIHDHDDDLVRAFGA